MHNLDDTCLMCSDGALKVIGDGYRKHHDKNFQDGRWSITMLIPGSSAESDGTVCFIENGKGVNKYFTAQKLVQKNVCLKFWLYLWMKLATWMMWLGKRLLQFLHQVSEKFLWVYNLFLFYLFALFFWRNELEGCGYSGGGVLNTLPLFVLDSSFIITYQIMT